MGALKILASNPMLSWTHRDAIVPYSLVPAMDGWWWWWERSNVYLREIVTLFGVRILRDGRTRRLYWKLVGRRAIHRFWPW